MTPLLSVDSVTKDLPGITLGPISLDLEPGLVYALVGPNGSGKSTLFRILMGLIQPGSGRVTRFGHELAIDAMAQSQRIAYVPEALTGHDAWSVRDLVEVYARSYDRFDRSVYAANVGDIDPNKRFSALSKGQQRRVFLALTLATKADMLLLDEPTDGIDPFARQDMISALAAAMDDGARSMLIATHNLDEVRRIADVVIVLDRGRQIGVWPKDTLLEGWQRLTVNRLPLAPVAGEVRREDRSIVTHDVAGARADLSRLGIDIVQSQPVDMVESLELTMAGVGDRASPHVPDDIT